MTVLKVRKNKQTPFGLAIKTSKLESGLELEKEEGDSFPLHGANSTVILVYFFSRLHSPFPP